MAWQVLAAMAASTAVTLMGQRQQMKQIKANLACAFNVFCFSY